jgi:hypothetical protein
LRLTGVPAMLWRLKGECNRCCLAKIGTAFARHAPRDLIDRSYIGHLEPDRADTASVTGTKATSQDRALLETKI